MGSAGAVVVVPVALVGQSGMGIIINAEDDK